ncbi:MAG: hypothetical protein QOD32_1391 [Pyrinomonadaceae bacterium]|jgi:hypothetical protein|nr:hypothetical protein [Pyrinomonadaceae bacterium]
MLFDNQFFSNLISTIIGTATGALFAYWFALRQFKIQTETEARKVCVDTALAFYQELSSHDFAQARTEANKMLEPYLTASSLDDVWSSMSQEKRRPILTVLSYFRRLQLSIQYKRIDEEMVLDLVSEEFFWWYFVWFNRLIPDDWETRRQIDKLDRWFQDNMPPTEYDRKKSYALSRLEVRMKKFQASQQVQHVNSQEKQS